MTWLPEVADSGKRVNPEAQERITGEMKASPRIACLAVAGIVGGIVLAGCGGSGNVAASQGPPHQMRVSFHSASRHYSVRQVDRAFAAQGVRLRNVSPKSYRGLLALLDGRPTNPVYVFVSIEGCKCMLRQPIRNANVTHHGNVEVLWRRPDAKAVRAALSELH